MKITLLSFLENITVVDAVAYICLLGVALIIYYFFVRLVFGIEKRIKQNDAIIHLLSLMAKKQGISDDDIHGGTK